MGAMRLDLNDWKDLERRVPFFVLLMLFVIPFGLQDVMKGVLVGFLVHSLIFLKAEDWKGAFLSPVFWVVSSFFIINFLNLFHAEDMAEGGRQLEIKSPFLIAPLLLVANKRFFQPELRNKALGAFLTGTLLASLYAVIRSVVIAIKAGSFGFTTDGGTYVSYLTYNELANALMHPGYFATYVGISLFIAFFFFIKQKSQRLKYGLILTFLSIFFILLQGRMNIIAFAVVCGGAVFVYALKRKMYWVLSLPAALVILFAYVGIMGDKATSNRFLQMPDFSYDITGDQFNSATYRLAEWTCAADVIKENFWFGTGVGDNRKALLDAYAARGFKKGLEYKFIAHNQYIETMLACGLIGLLVLIAMLVLIGKKLIKHRDYLALMSLVFIALSLLTESMFERTLAIVLFSVFFPFVLLQKEEN